MVRESGGDIAPHVGVVVHDQDLDGRQVVRRLGSTRAGLAGDAAGRSAPVAGDAGGGCAGDRVAVARYGEGGDSQAVEGPGSRIEQAQAADQQIKEGKDPGILCGIPYAAKDLFDVFGSYNLTVIPLFILMGQISFHAGISSRLFEVAYKFIGHWPGGMAIATIGACAGFSAICGSTNATAATMAAVTLPEMRKYHYKDTIAAGVVAAGGSLGILVPPSVVFIIYGIMTEQSIGKLFMAGILPGLLLAGLFILALSFRRSQLSRPI